MKTRIYKLPEDPPRMPRFRAWQKKNLHPIDRNGGDYKLAVRTGKHACQRGSVQIHTKRLVGVTK